MIPHSEPWILERDLLQLREVVLSKKISKHEITKQIESDTSAYLNKKHALFTGNATQAQILILKALGIGKGDEVILPSYVCDKVLKGVIAVGAIPVICDVGLDWVMNMHTIKPHVTHKTKAIILVHIFGINAYDKGFENFNIPIIEDICQSYGKDLNGNISGANTDYAFTSFHGTKMIGAGEGGMLYVNDTDLFNEITDIKKVSGYFTSGNEMVSSLVLSQIERLEENLTKRRNIAEIYNAKLPNALTTKMKKLFRDTVFFRYLIQTNKGFSVVKEHYENYGIAVRQAVDILNHRVLILEDSLYPNAVNLFNNTISIPILPMMSDKEILHVVGITNNLYKEDLI